VSPSRINIKGAIATLSGQQIIDQCRDGVTSVCQFLVRDPATNLLTQVLIKPANVISQGTKGIDLEMSYRFALASLVDDWNGGLTLRGFGNHVISRATNNPAAIPNVVEVAGTPAAPDFRYTASLAYDLDPITVTLTLNGVSSAVYNNERVICTTGCPLTTAGNPTYNLNDIDSARSFDLSLNYKVLETDNASVDAFFFVKNIGNSMPPLIAGEVSAGLFQSQATQDYADWRNGRTFRAGVRFKL
jgi:iron complex outermembrane receptor protein